MESERLERSDELFTKKQKTMAGRRESVGGWRHCEISSWHGN